MGVRDDEGGRTLASPSADAAASHTPYTAAGLRIFSSMMVAIMACVGKVGQRRLVWHRKVSWLREDMQ